MFRSDNQTKIFCLAFVWKFFEACKSLILERETRLELVTPTLARLYRNPDKGMIINEKPGFYPQLNFPDFWVFAPIIPPSTTHER